ncbi:MAG: hypothetical protein K8T91_17760 [Planctomycetes bacterium]|nr:hypothetical protein [Planctomycetota bacterium]
MKIQEVIYTSASELLEDTTGHLGIVAKSRGIPQDVEIELRAHRAYSLLPDISVDAVDAHPPRFIFSTYGHGSAFFGVTRIVFAGADHTGRTTPLAHHLLVSRVELNGTRPAEFITATKESYVGRWNGQARWIEPARVISILPQGGTSPACLEELIGGGTTLLATLSRIAETLVLYPIAQRPVVVCVPRTASTRILELMAVIVDMLPSSIQLETHGVSHVISPTDQPRGFALALTYADTPFMRHCTERQDERRPVVADLTRVSTLPKAVEGTYGTLVANALKSGGMRAVHDLAIAWDDMGLDTTLIELFPAVVKLREGLAGEFLCTPGSANRLASLLGELSAGVKLQQPVSDLCLAAVQRLGNSSTPSRWETLAFIGVDRRWPQNAREWCLDFICYDRSALKQLVLLGHSSSSDSNVTDAQLGALIAARPQLISIAIESARSTLDKADIEVLSRILELAKLRFEEGCKLLPHIASLPWESDGSLLSASCHMVQRSIKSADHILRLCATPDSAPYKPLVDQVCLPLLIKSLKQVQEQTAWHELSQCYLTLGLQQNRVREHLQWLLSNCRERISDATVNKWLKDDQGAPRYGRELRDIVEQLQLLPAPPVGGSERRLPTPHVPQVSTLILKEYHHKGTSESTNPGPMLLPAIVGTLTLLIGIGLTVYLWQNGFRTKDILPIWFVLLPPMLLWRIAEFMLPRMIHQPKWFWVGRDIRWGITVVMMLVYCSLVEDIYQILFAT